MHGAATFVKNDKGVSARAGMGSWPASRYPGGVAKDSCPDFVGAHSAPGITLSRFESDGIAANRNSRHAVLMNALQQG